MICLLLAQEEKRAFFLAGSASVALTGFAAPISVFLSPSPVGSTAITSGAVNQPSAPVVQSVAPTASSGTPTEAVYVVKNGDYADLIAHRHRMTLDELRNLNSQNGTLEVMHIGDTLKVRCPPSGCISETLSPTAKLYIVKAGDTAADVAKQHGLTLDQLRALKPSLGTMDIILIGNSVVIGDSSAGAPDLGDVYVVQPGDFAGKIATRFGMTLDELIQLNPDKGTMDLIKIGDLIKLKPGSRSGSFLDWLHCWN